MFANSERSKWKVRDKLVVREDLGHGMYRLDRFKDSGRITRAFLPARDLFKFSPQTPKHPLPETDSTDTNNDPLAVDNQDLDSTGPSTEPLDAMKNTHGTFLPPQ